MAPARRPPRLLSRASAPRTALLASTAAPAASTVPAASRMARRRRCRRMPVAISFSTCSTAAPALAATARAFELSLLFVVIWSSLSCARRSQHRPGLAFAQELVELAGRRLEGIAQRGVEV